MTFPCDPDSNRSWISAPNCLHANTTQTITSGNGQAIAGFNASGYFTLRHVSGAVLWSAPIGRPSPGLDFRKNQACLQFDAELIVFEPASQPGQRNKILWASDKNAEPVGPYFASVGNDCSLCTWPGAPNGPGQPHPPFATAIWCGFQGPCPSGQDVGFGTTLRPRSQGLGSTPRPRRGSSTRGSSNRGDDADDTDAMALYRDEVFPSSCSFASWQRRGMDVHSVVADPMIADPTHDDWQLNASSPALALGFIQLNLSAVGPRPPD